MRTSPKGEKRPVGVIGADLMIGKIVIGEIQRAESVAKDPSILALDGRAAVLPSINCSTYQF